MDQITGQYVDKYQEKLVSSRNGAVDDSELDDEELLDLLDDDEYLEGYREKRKQELAKQFQTARRNIEDGYGKLNLVETEKELMDQISDAKISIVHFAHPDFRRCAKMSRELSKIAVGHLETKIFEIEAANAPFLVTRLGVKVLPFVVAYNKGNELVRLVGFEFIGGDDFTTKDLEAFLIRHGALNRANTRLGHGSKPATNEGNDEDLFDD